MFKLEFSTDNAAFLENGVGYEIGKILFDTNARVAEGSTFGAVKDSNGNTVGRWSLTYEDEP